MCKVCLLALLQTKNSAFHCLIDCQQQSTLVVNNAPSEFVWLDSNVVLQLFRHTKIVPSRCVEQQAMYSSTRSRAEGELSKRP
jgi:hypothetical protein